MWRVDDTTATYGHAPNLWNSAKEKLRTELWRPASVRRTMTYGEAVGFIRNLIVLDPHDHVFHEMLVQISVEEDANGRGMLSAIVVHLADGQPGNGFFDLAGQLGRNISDRLACWVREVSRLYEEAAHILRTLPASEPDITLNQQNQALVFSEIGQMN